MRRHTQSHFPRILNRTIGPNPFQITMRLISRPQHETFNSLSMGISRWLIGTTVESNHSMITLDPLPDLGIVMVTEGRIELPAWDLWGPRATAALLCDIKLVGMVRVELTFCPYQGHVLTVVLHSYMVPRTGLEPVIFRVKGVCLSHLD